MQSHYFFNLYQNGQTQKLKQETAQQLYIVYYLNGHILEFFQVPKLEKHIVQRNEQFYMNVVHYSENYTKKFHPQT